MPPFNKEVVRDYKKILEESISIDTSTPKEPTLGPSTSSLSSIALGSNRLTLPIAPEI